MTTLDRLTSALADRYRVTRELGAGGMATVYLAHDLRHERDVAIKVLHPDLGAALGADRFLAEIKTTAKLQHPHILPLLDSGEADGLLFYVMPYVKGETLRARLARGPVPIAESAELLRNVLQALQYAHDAGIMHRDIKPENILLASGTAVVADFGIAKALSTSRTQAGNITLTQAGMAVGTPAYMAPEQAAGDPNTDSRADLYAWGIVAYEALTGAHPFARHVTPQAMITAHMTEVPTNLTSLVTALPASIAEVVTACLAKHPNERPASAGEALARFETYRTPSALPTRSAPPGLRRRLTAAAMLLAASAAGAWWWASRAEASGVPRSLAVLPFDIGADTANAYLADGISAELTTKLSRVPGLVVRAYSSSKNVSAKDPQAAAKALGVATVLNATVRRDNERLHVNASLIAGDDARVLWSESFDERDVDQFALQARLAEAIAGALRVQLTPEARRAVAARTTRDPIAHDLVQRSLFLADQVTPASIAQAVAMAEQAIARDSNYVDAWLALARAWMFAADDIYPGAKVLESMQHPLERAAALDPRNVELLATAGTIQLWYMRDTAAAIRSLHDALALDSTNAMALVPYASWVYRTDPDSAGRVTATAIRHNPTTTLSLYFSLWTPSVFRTMSADSAKLVCTRLRVSVPPLGEYCDVARLAQRGDRAAAAAAWRAVDTSTFTVPSVYAWRALAASIVGDTALTRGALASVERVATAGYVREDAAAVAAARVGDRAMALRWARRALASRAAGAFYIDGPDFRELRGDPEYEAIRRELYGVGRRRP